MKIKAKKIERTMHRQGDLLFVPCVTIPTDAKPQEDGVIARGETTGHAHRIRQGMQAMLMITAAMAYVKAVEETAVDHEEHATVMLPIGNYEVRRQREHTPDGWRQVAD